MKPNEIEQRPKKVDPDQKNSYNGVRGKKVLDFNDLSGLPKDIRERMNPVREHIRGFALDVVEDALRFVEGNPIDQVTLKIRLQKLSRLLSHLEGKSDENTYNPVANERSTPRASVGSNVEVRGMASRKTRRDIMAQLEHERIRKGAFTGNRTPQRPKI